MTPRKQGYFAVLKVAGLEKAATNRNPNLGLWSKKPTGGKGLQSSARANPVNPKP